MKVKLLVLICMIFLCSSAYAFWFLLRVGAAASRVGTGTAAVRGTTVARGSVVDSSATIQRNTRNTRVKQNPVNTNKYIDKNSSKNNAVRDVDSITNNTSVFNDNPESNIVDNDLKEKIILECQVFDKVNGHAVEIIRYIGECKNNYAHGVGQVVWKYKGKFGTYSGDFEYGKFNGLGQAYYVEGIHYQGVWKDSWEDNGRKTNYVGNVSHLGQVVSNQSNKSTAIDYLF